MLYPDELQALRKQLITRKHYFHTKKNQNHGFLVEFFANNKQLKLLLVGAEDSNPDPLLPKQVRYQTAPYPET